MTRQNDRRNGSRNEVMNDAMNDAITPMEENPEQRSSVYGPVRSWRAGVSLGVDLLLHRSTCSFNCIYCQLGDIQLKTAERKVYVSTDQVAEDLRRSPWREADVITLSGSGEPTLALNLGEVIRFLKNETRKPVMVLTNATLLHDPAVIADLQAADVVACKLDAATEAGLRQMNRPVPGITLETIVSGIKRLRAVYTGKLAIQCMFMPANLQEAAALADCINEIQPDEVQLNTPKRPYPLEWRLESRGNHTETSANISADKAEDAAFSRRPLRTVSLPEAEAIESLLRQRTHAPILSIYRQAG